MLQLFIVMLAKEEQAQLFLPFSFILELLIILLKLSYSMDGKDFLMEGESLNLLSKDMFNTSIWPVRDRYKVRL